VTETAGLRRRNGLQKKVVSAVRIWFPAVTSQLGVLPNGIEKAVIVPEGIEKAVIVAAGLGVDD
jgi:hypothetical protein